MDMFVNLKTKLFKMMAAKMAERYMKKNFDIDIKINVEKLILKVDDKDCHIELGACIDATKESFNRLVEIYEKEEV